MSETEFDFEVIATGSFLDGDPAFLGKVYRVETVMIRLNSVALEAYFKGLTNLVADDFESEEACYLYNWGALKHKKEFERAVADVLGFDPEVGGLSIRQIRSEVFGVVYITVEKKVEN